jgi:hypothetical protein
MRHLINLRDTILGDINTPYEAAIWNTIADEWIAKIPDNMAEYMVAMLVVEPRMAPALREGLIDRIAQQAGRVDMLLQPVHEAVASLYALRRGQAVRGATEPALRSLITGCGADAASRRAGVLMASLPGVLHRARVRWARSH